MNVFRYKRTTRCRSYLPDYVQLQHCIFPSTPQCKADLALASAIVRRNSRYMER